MRMLAGKALDARLLSVSGPMMRRVQGVRCSWLMGCLHSKTTTGRFGSKLSLRGLGRLVAAFALSADGRPRATAHARKAIAKAPSLRARVLEGDGAKLGIWDRFLFIRCVRATCLTIACDATERRVSRLANARLAA